MSLNQWYLRSPGDAIPQEIIEKYCLPPMLVKLLEARGISSEADVANAVSGDGGELNDPLLMAGMTEAVKRINRAIESGEKLAIYGDYDVDGVTSVYILADYLKSRGVICEKYIPDRTGEGYGVNEPALMHLADCGCTLVITVDCGITAVAETKAAALRGLELVITDHHEPGETLPDAVSAVDPRRRDCPYPFKELAGVGVVFKLICALSGESGDEILARYGDMIALGTIADVMSLTGENRRIVMRGLDCLKNTANLGLRALCEASLGKTGLSVTAIGYRISPRINAAGRMANAYEALSLFESENTETARLFAHRLCELNTRRQSEESELFSVADAEVKADIEGVQRRRSVVICGKGWHQGVIGIIASRLADKYSVPAVVLTDDGKEANGSARSIRGFNIFAALSEATAGLGSCGGHMMAAGVHLPSENVQAFTEAFSEITSRGVTDEMMTSSLDIDCELMPELLTPDGMESVTRLEPFGAGNPQPLFVLRDAVITGIAPIGDGKHLKMNFRCGNRPFSAVGFGMPPAELRYRSGDAVDLAFNVEMNTYAGLTSARMLLRDIHPSRELLEMERGAGDAVRSLIERGDCPDTAAPARSLLAALWRILASGSGRRTVSPAMLNRQLGDAGITAEPLTAMLALRIFEEAGLAVINGKREYNTAVEIRAVTGKRVQLTDSETYVKLRPEDIL